MVFVAIEGKNTQDKLKHGRMDLLEISRIFRIWL